MKIIVSIIILIFAGCNPVKKIQRAQRLTDYVNTVKPVAKDSIVYLKGRTEFFTDTIQVIADSTTVIKYYTKEITHDTIKVITENNDRLNSFFRENERLKAEVKANKIIDNHLKGQLKTMVIVCFVLLIALGFTISKVFHL